MPGYLCRDGNGLQKGLQITKRRHSANLKTGYRKV